MDGSVTTPSATPNGAPSPERFTTARSTLLVDRFMTAFIKVGGIGIILAVLAIGVFILAQVIPLFQGASVRQVQEIDLRPTLSTEDEPVVLGLDEWGERPFVLTRSGSIAFATAAGVEPAQPFTGGRRITAAHYDLDRQQVALGFVDGTAQRIHIAYTPGYDGGKRVIASAVEPGAPVALGVDGAITDLAWVTPDDAPLIAAIISPATGSPATATPRLLVKAGAAEPEDLTASVTGTPTRILADDRGESLVVVSATGDVTYLFREAGKFTVRQVFRPFSDGADQRVASISWLYGDVSLVATSGDGLNRQFSLFIRPGDDKRTFGMTKEFERLAAGARFTSMSVRNKAFLVASGAHASLRFGTSAATRWSGDLPFTPALGVINSKYNRIVMAGDDAKLRLFTLSDPHPEASIAAFFGKVWYEGFAEPKYEWQSTGGTDDFEPKLSMVNLMFGTFKATFYAMLFAVPIALLGAIYTAEFMAPRFKSIVKPTVEIMAALPSVVLGFLAAMWLAPAIESRFPSILLLLLIVPAVACGFGFLWSRFSPAVRSRIPAGWEFILLIPVLAVVGWFAWSLGPVLERAVFTITTPDGQVVADFRRWWAATTGMAYEQRNSLVVGVIMGFAVIPIIFTIAEDSLTNVPPALRSASLALGASRWQTAIRIVVPTASAGIFSGLMIGLGRAIGETMIVVMATGNTGIIDWNIFNGMRTLSANIAVELPEAPHGGTLYRALFLGALLLFAFTFAVNTLAEVMRARLREKYKTV